MIILVQIERVLVKGCEVRRAFGSADLEGDLLDSLDCDCISTRKSGGFKVLASSSPPSIRSKRFCTRNRWECRVDDRI